MVTESERRRMLVKLILIQVDTMYTSRYSTREAKRDASIRLHWFSLVKRLSQCRIIKRIFQQLKIER